MDLRFTEEQEMLRKAVRDFLSTECPKEKVRELEKSEIGYSPDIWHEIANLGWLGLTIPEKYGGNEMSFLHLALLIEEMGRNIYPSPFLPTVMSTLPIIEEGTEEQRENILPRIAIGDLIVTMAIWEESGTFDTAEINTTAALLGNEYWINGIKLFVEMGHVADYFIVVAKAQEEAVPEEQITLFVVDAKSPGITCEVIPTIAKDKLCQVQFSDVKVPIENVLGKPNSGWPIIRNIMRRGAIAKCAESLGGMQSCVDMTVDYSKERVQYGRPIGAFQALQHIMADMWTTLQTGRYLTYKAAWMESEGIDCTKEASMAKSYVNEAYKFVSKWGVRLHGAIGTSLDHDISLYYRIAKAADTAFGSTDMHREIVAEQIGLMS